MKPLERLLHFPVFFKRNRVRRIYTGGALLDEFLGTEKGDGDGFFPEEWIASTVRALNEGASNSEGHSFIENASEICGREVTFAELLAVSPEKALGKNGAFDVLVKFLDSAVRLPVQAHPTKAFSRKNFGCDYGKTESWLVLATRENAEIYFGFNREMTKEEFSAAVERGKTDKNALVPLLGKTAVKAGDLFLIPAGLAHAIGYGCLILEVQEPTDFTIQPEHFCGDYALSEREMYIGLTKDVALDCFDYSLYGEKAISVARRTPKLQYACNDYDEYALISYSDTPCFAFSRFDVKGTLALNGAPALYIVTEGKGEVVSLGGVCVPDPNGVASAECGDAVSPTLTGYNRQISRGDFFFLPAAAKEFAIKGALSVVRVLPSTKNA